jgi:alkanesulfonate monooxygenase SsuD/methylene tetrahydromethanopterin reductase-like flavin-dependent oxidoreductase (luciferase family)
MKIGIGLPNNVAGAPGPLMVDWARRAEHRGFESVTTIDRLVYPSLDSIVALALAAGATTDLALVTNVLLAPLYPPAILAKQLETLALAAGDRLTVGVAVGARADDYLAAGVDFDRRGRLLDEEVTAMREAWRGAPFRRKIQGDTATRSDGRRRLGRRGIAGLQRAVRVRRSSPCGVARGRPGRQPPHPRVGQRRDRR